MLINPDEVVTGDHQGAPPCRTGGCVVAIRRRDYICHRCAAHPRRMGAAWTSRWLAAARVQLSHSVLEVAADSSFRMFEDI
jgi:hypothetical protein